MDDPDRDHEPDKSPSEAFARCCWMRVWRKRTPPPTLRKISLDSPLQKVVWAWREVAIFMETAVSVSLRALRLPSTGPIFMTAALPLPGPVYRPPLVPEY
jgi:hypothetical protein